MSRLQQLVIVDSDPNGLPKLTYGFEREGFAVAGTTDAAMAGDLIRTTEPQVVVIALRDNVGANLELARRIAAAPEDRRHPVIVIGAPELRDAASNLRGIDFLPLPVFARDLLTVAKMVVALRLDGDEPVLRGSLSDYGIFFLVRAMAATGRSGVLTLERSNRRAEMRFADGELTSCQVASLQGFAAFHQLLLWAEAALELRIKPVLRRGQFPMRADELIEDGERFLRDFAHAAEGIGNAQALLVQDVARLATHSATLPAEVGQVVRLFDGQRSLGDVVEDSPFRAFDTIRIVGRLVEMKILQSTTESGVPGRPSRTTLDAWLTGGGTPAPTTVPASGTQPGMAPIRDVGGAGRGAGPAPSPGATPAPAAAAPATRPSAVVPVAPTAAPAPAFAPLPGRAPIPEIPSFAQRTTSGAIEARVSVQHAAVSTGPSIIIDDELASAKTPPPTPALQAPPPVAATPPPVARPAMAATPAPAPRPAPVVAPAPIAAPAPAPAPAAAVAATPAPIATTSARAAAPATPAPAAKPAAAAAGPAPKPAAAAAGSIEIDPELLAEMQAMEAMEARSATPITSPALPAQLIAATPPPAAAPTAPTQMLFAPPKATAPTIPAAANLPAAGNLPPAMPMVTTGPAPVTASAAPAPLVSPPAAVVPPPVFTPVAPPPAAVVPPPVFAPVAPAPAAVVAPPIAPAPVTAPAPGPLAAAPAMAAAPAPSATTAGKESAPAPAPVPQGNGGAPAPRSGPTTGDHKRTRPTSSKGHRVTPSAAFDALESEFFAREADLYKPEAADDFADLDGAAPSKPAASGAPRRAPAGKGKGRNKR